MDKLLLPKAVEGLITNVSVRILEALMKAIEASKLLCDGLLDEAAGAAVEAWRAVNNLYSLVGAREDYREG